MSDSSVIIVDLDVRGEREITRLADALKRWLHQQELTADIDTGRRVFTPNANCGTIAVCPRCSRLGRHRKRYSHRLGRVPRRGRCGLPSLRAHQPRFGVGMA